ncbi:putative membrane protein [Streptomyces olivoverticillatus]|uniref:Putative membrane protein n=1 Tax=Streptomyces olivoverticillatus TaxID=66427 RepID=A0A7W7LT53_9ACTN|nr:vitamin K epoxide reductase family protein [Streptomyces olivoverticillatus]MBB4895136.1 putative membrane protein [Streptomyces olivoverticillatus]
MTTSALDRSDTDDVERDGPGTGAVGGSRAFALLLVITGALGVLASWVITLDKFKLLEDPNFVPGCSLNPIVSCGNIMKSEQAHAFGFPNPMLGLATYSVIVAIGLGLLGGARFPRWYWLGMEAGCLFGVGFVTWLQYQSLYVIGSLCLWCCLAWVATIVMFCYVTVQNIRHRFIPVPEGLRRGLLEFHWVVPVLWVGVIGMLILTKWWWFWTGGTP